MRLIEIRTIEIQLKMTIEIQTMETRTIVLKSQLSKSPLDDLN